MGLYENGHPEHCLPGTLNISFEFVEGGKSHLEIRYGRYLRLDRIRLYLWLNGTFPCSGCIGT